MERNHSKYVVGKVSDMQECLTEFEFGLVVQILTKVDMHRMNQGKHAMRAVVVEEDWPMHEHVWKCIEAWVDAIALDFSGHPVTESKDFYYGQLKLAATYHKILGLNSQCDPKAIEKPLQLLSSVFKLASEVVGSTYVTPDEAGVNVALTKPELIGRLDDLLDLYKGDHLDIRKAASIDLAAVAESDDSGPEPVDTGVSRRPQG